MADQIMAVTCTCHCGNIEITVPHLPEKATLSLTIK